LLLVPQLAESRAPVYRCAAFLLLIQGLDLTGGSTYCYEVKKAITGVAARSSRIVIKNRQMEKEL
jgi:hypothetical protein